MNRFATKLLLLPVLFSLASFCSAQVEFVDRLNKEFLSRKPEIGKQAKNVEVFDETGNPFSLNKTRGKHTVLIFGCLT